MEKPAPNRCAASEFLPAMAAASTNSSRRTASRCTRPMKPVPKIAVLIGFIAFVIRSVLDPPSSFRLLTNHDAVEKAGGLGQTLLRREQAVFMFDRQRGIVAEHPQRRDKLAPPLGPVTVAASTENPAAVALMSVRFRIEHASAWKVGWVNLRVLGMDVEDGASKYANGGDRIDALPEEMAGIEVATDA